MRNLVISNLMSLDGFVADRRGSMIPIGSDAQAEAFNTYNAERLRSATTLLAGRRTFEDLERYWPPIEDDETADGTQREISRMNNRADKVVVSDTYEAPAGSPWAAATRVVGRNDAVEAVRALKEGPGRDIIVFGSATTWNALLDAGLVDELHLMVTPVVLGDGMPAFTHGGERALELLDVTRFEEASTVVLRYAPHDGVSPPRDRLSP